MGLVRRGFELALEVISALLLAALLAIVVAGVVSRTLGDSFSWYDEVASVVLAWFTYFGAALAAQKRAHLGSPELVQKLAPPVRLGLFVLAEVVVLGFFGVVTVYGWRVLDAMAFDTLTSLPWVPERAVQAIIPIGGALFLCAELLSLPSALAGVRAGVNWEERAREEAIQQAQASKPAAAEG